MPIMYVVFSPWRRLGFASRAVRLLIQHANVLFPGRPVLFRIHPDNGASLALARAFGARPEGSERSRTGRLLERWVLQGVPPPAGSPAG
jgi:RimJ/RimL family protein N-acetyltransferase